MAKIITLNSKNVLGRDYQIMDTWGNVQIVDDGLAGVFKALDETDKKAQKLNKKGEAISDSEYFKTLSVATLKGVEALLNLNDKDRDKLKQMSYSDLEKFYGDCCEQFTGIPLPTMKALRANVQAAMEQEDAPKEASQN